MARLWYATLESVKRAADVNDSALADALVRESLDAGMDAVHGLLKRQFAPILDTKYFPWPQDRYQRPNVLYLDRHEVYSVTALTVAVGDTNTVVPASDIHLGPAPHGPPYSEITLPDGAATVLQRGTDQARSISLQALYCGASSLDEVQAATTVSTLSGTSLTVSDVSRIETGSLIRVGTERLIVTARSWIDSGNLEPVTLTANANDTAIPVTSGSAFHVGEDILLDAEQMTITAIAGDTLVVKRARNGTALAAHTAVIEVYVQRALTVARGQLGSTQADQASTGLAVWLFQFPGLAVQLHRAETQVNMEQSRSAWARVSGGGETATEAVERGLARLRKDARRALGRKFRLPGDGGR